jgi:hypothetical protein
MGKGGLWARVAALAGAGWLAGTAELAWARIAPGPRTLDEVATMVVTSLLLPPAATWHWLDGWRRLAALLADTARAPRSDRARPAAELYDRGLLLGAEEAGRPTAFPAGRAR